MLTRDGRLLKSGIVRTSGVTAFDLAALDSVQRASPFGPAPAAVVSTDANVYVHWAVSPRRRFRLLDDGVRPYLLNVPDDQAPDPERPSTSPTPPGELGLPP